jgi:hypothetical protein
MKKANCILALLFMFSSAIAQKTITVPKEAQAAFKKDYPHMKGKWEKEQQDFEVNFTQNGKKMSAVYDATGNKLESEVGINISGLPASVTDYIHKKYPKAKITEAAIITKANGEINYEAQVSGMDMIFDKDGKYLRTTND